MAMEYFCAYHSLLESLTPYGDAECGRLFKACLQYSKTSELPDLRGNERFIWPTLQAMIDRDTEAYEKKCLTLKENGAKGGRPPKNQKNQMVSEETKENQMVFEETKEEEEESGKEGEKKSSPLKPPLKENTQEKGKEGEEELSARAKKPRAKKPFVPPTLEEVRAYVAERGSSVDPVQFWQYFNAGNWIDAKGQPVLAWKQKLITWESYDKKPARTVKPNDIHGSAGTGPIDQKKFDAAMAALDRI